jgi:hypothetical protein
MTTISINFTVFSSPTSAFADVDGQLQVRLPPRSGDLLDLVPTNAVPEQFEILHKMVVEKRIVTQANQIVIYILEPIVLGSRGAAVALIEILEIQLRYRITEFGKD